MLSVIRFSAIILTSISVGSFALRAADASRASELMKNRQYNDAIKILLEDVKGKPDAEAARQSLMLGECYYLIGNYAESKPWFAKAQRFCADENLPGDAVAELR